MVLPQTVETSVPQPINFYKKWLERLTTDELDAEIQRLKTKADTDKPDKSKWPIYLRLV